MADFPNLSLSPPTLYSPQKCLCFTSRSGWLEGNSACRNAVSMRPRPQRSRYLSTNCRVPKSIFTANISQTGPRLDVCFMQSCSCSSNWAQMLTKDPPGFKKMAYIWFAAFCTKKLQTQAKSFPSKPARLPGPVTAKG